ncbi:hypothetical protein [Allonocardiopsis opalescens]|uniref:hypothetical protein n=1 Tax=Allonocardiopsis opalescens TaxID=1144618 RepID=UPI000D054363|nr:hypothetical protein [Allonocardiopsis opalescens]
MTDDDRAVFRRLAAEVESADDQSSFGGPVGEGPDLAAVVDVWSARLDGAEAPDCESRGDWTVVARTAHRLGALPDAAALFGRSDVPAHQVARDLANLERSDRLAGSPRRRDDIFTGLLRQFAGGETAHAVGAAAELRAAGRLLGDARLAEGGRIALDARRGERIDLGNGVVLGDIAPVPQADLVYVTADRVVNLAEVKATAQTLADKMRKDPDQLDRMLEWRGADPDMRRVEVHIATENGWTGVFSRMRPESEERYAIERLIVNGIPVCIEERVLMPDELQVIFDATFRAYVDNGREFPGGPGGWFAQNLPTLSAAREFLRPYGVDFL